MKKHQKEYRQFLAEIGPEAFKSRNRYTLLIIAGDLSCLRLRAVSTQWRSGGYGVA